MAKLPLADNVKETAILTCVSDLDGAYALYAHTEIATKLGLLSHEQIEQIKKGEKPDGLSEACGVACEVVRWLLGEKKPLADKISKRCMEAFGIEGTMGLMHAIGYYAYMSIAMNAFEVAVPSAAGIGVAREASFESWRSFS